MSNSSSKVGLILVLMVLLIGLGGGALGFQLWTTANSPANPSKKDPYYLEVTKKEGPSEITRNLLQAGVIADAQQFLWIGRLTRSWGKIKAGEYAVNPSMTPLEILSTIRSGVSVGHPFTIREGENLYEIAAELEKFKPGAKTKFVTLAKDPKFLKQLGFSDPLPPSLEGYLFPDTYNLTRLMTIEDCAKAFHKHFQTSWSEADTSKAKSLGLTKHQALTLASIIEKETGAPQERPMISSVFHNRLKKGMKLQSDPTIIYGIWERYDGNLHKEDITSNTPFNTYVIPALPIGPIGNPGKESISAALNPVQSEFLFFVSHNDGTHEFTKTYGDHTKAVKKFQLDPKAREGKSWRDLGKK